VLDEDVELVEEDDVVVVDVVVVLVVVVVVVVVIVVVTTDTRVFCVYSPNHSTPSRSILHWKS
jgi:hypothetical protein